MFRKKQYLILAGLFAVVTISVCFTGAFAIAEEKPKVALIVNRPVGDQGPIDNQVKGLEVCEQELGFTTKVLESTSPDRFEEDIRAMAKEGYDLIITSFPPVTEPARMVAIDYPNVKFVGIYQFGNIKKPLPNYWDTEYRSQETMYVLGALAGKLTKTNRIGYISGQETASSNSGIHGFMKAVAQACPQCSVEFAFTNSYDDPATGKEMAKAMISRGIDIIQTAAGRSSQGVVEAAKESGALMLGDNADFFDQYEKGYISWVYTNFGANVSKACKDFKANTLEGGKHTYMNLANGGAVVMWDKIDRFVKANPNQAEKVNKAKEYALSIQKQVIDGKITVEFNPKTPTTLKPSK